MTTTILGVHLILSYIISVALTILLSKNPSEHEAEYILSSVILS